MPSKYPRIAVTKDPQLGAALDRVAPLLGRSQKPATVVHDLAIRGAEQVLKEHRRRRETLEALSARSTRRDGLDRELLARLDDEAWGIPAPDE